MFKEGDAIYYLDDWEKKVHYGVFSHYGGTVRDGNKEVRMVWASWDGRDKGSLGWMPEDRVFPDKIKITEITYDENEWV